MLSSKSKGYKNVNVSLAKSVKIPSDWCRRCVSASEPKKE